MTTSTKMKFYTPTLPDAIHVFLSYFWRSVVLFIIAIVPLLFISFIVLGPEIQNSISQQEPENIRRSIEDMAQNSKHLLLLISFTLNTIIGFIALREVIKIQYPHFQFKTEEITAKHLWIVSIAINGFYTLFQPTMGPMTLLMSFLFFAIQIIVGIGILWRFMSASFLGIYLPLEER